jgi:superfamily II DNA/RNA helicase
MLYMTAKQKRKFEEEQRALAKVLVASGKTYREVAEALDMSVGTVHNIMKEKAEDIAPIIKEIRRRFAAKTCALSDHLLNKITNADIENATLIQKVTASAILMDKARQLGMDDAGGIEQTGGKKENPFEINENGQ